MVKTRAQLDKQKRAAEKRKQTEKAILKIAAGMPEDTITTTPTPPAPTPKATRDKS